MTETPRLLLPLIAAAQSQKHVTHNEALSVLDAFVALSFVSRTLTDPPATPTDGALYLVAAPATGDWTGKEGQIAAARSGGWMFLTPVAGVIAYDREIGTFVAYDGAAWSDLGDRITMSSLATLGVNATADTTNRLAVSAPAALFAAESADIRVTLNKAGVTDTASVVFQTGYSGRAEFGLTGDDDWHVKVSADGAAWSEALVADAATGAVKLPNGMSEPLTLAAYTIAALPAASGQAGGLAYCTNASGGAVPVFSDGTNWRAVTDRAIIA